MPKQTTPQSLDLGKTLRAERDKLAALDKRTNEQEEKLTEIKQAIAATPVLRYHPLSGFGCADYVEEYAHMIESAGIFDALKYSAAELRLSRDVIDLAGLAALGSAFTQALAKAAGVAEDGTPTSAKKVRALITDHCQRFKVQVKNDTGQWLDLADAETIDSHLDFGQMIDVVFALAGGVLRPLWSRLRSPAAAMRSESPKPSMSATPAS